jgi:hypothetical protein
MTRGDYTGERVVDLDLHGVVGIRLIDPSPSDVAVVERQLRLPEQPLGREPDVVVRFVDALPIEGLRFAEFGQTGFTDDGFYVLQSRKRAARVRIGFEGIGDCCEIVCQRGVRSVPLLMAIVTLTALKRDCVPLHASAFVHRGTGVLVTGWAKGGKTEALLAFAAQGAEYIGDEWILLTRDGRRMYGVPEFIRLQEWHLRQMPDVRRSVRASRRMLFELIRGLDRFHGAVAEGGIDRLLPTGLLTEALPALRRQLNVQLDPFALFARGPRAFAASPDRVFLMLSHDEPTMRVSAVDPLEIARRMVASNCYEQQPLLNAYLAYRFAFPGRRNEFIERAPALQAEILESALAGKEAYEVRHPYPMSLKDLYAAMRPYCEARGADDLSGDGSGMRPTVPLTSVAADTTIGQPRGEEPLPWRP